MLSALLAMREMILAGELAAGERISELIVAERTGISRTPIRAALQRLQEEGLVEAISSGGFAVRSFSERDVFDAIEIRGTLEGLAARFAAEAGPSRAAQSLRECVTILDDVVANALGHAERTGKKVMFAFNLTGDINQMRRRHDLVERLGGTCVMTSLNSIGISGMIELGRHSRLPIHAHRNGWGYLARHPLLGFSYVAWQKFWRLAGADHMHVNGLANKFSEPDDSVIEAARACLAPMFEGKPCIVMPVFSSGQTAKQVAGTFAALGSINLIHAAGGGILAHPDGPAGGVAAMREAWDAAQVGIPATTHALSHPSLAAALQTGQ